MKKINFHFSSTEILHNPVRVFDEHNISFLHELSTIILKNKDSYQYSDLISVGFWARKANISKIMQENHFLQNNHGRGLCFHVTPSNVPLTFVFSCFFSLLAGNSNIVRIPSKPFPQVELFLKLFKTAAQNHSVINERVSFISYPKDNKITEEISKIADVRMLWGGDTTINEIKKIYSSPHCLDIAFYDRFSLCIINCDALKQLSEKEFQMLIKNFYNDTFLMDQNACSSPQIILWENADTQIIEQFWNKLFLMTETAYPLKDALAVDKFVTLCSACIQNNSLKKVIRNTNYLYRLELENLNCDMNSLKGSGGFFYEYKLNSREELFRVINNKFQTITYFGIDAEILKSQIINARVKGVDRIVPIGKALDMNIYWDGYNLLQYLSKIIYAE